MLFSCTVKLRFSSSQKGNKTFYVSSTVCQSKNFSVTKILREINLKESRRSKNAVFAISGSGALKFANLANYSLQKVPKFKIIKSKL